MCGGPGMGKSMRAKRLMAILCDGWIKGSGSASAKAGMNGGMDYLCGRLVYFDVRCLPPPTKMVGTLAECSGFCARRR